MSENRNYVVSGSLIREVLPDASELLVAVATSERQAGRLLEQLRDRKLVVEHADPKHFQTLNELEETRRKLVSLEQARVKSEQGRLEAVSKRLLLQAALKKEGQDGIKLLKALGNTEELLGEAIRERDEVERLRQEANVSRQMAERDLREAEEDRRKAERRVQALESANQKLRSSIDALEDRIAWGNSSSAEDAKHKLERLREVHGKTSSHLAIVMNAAERFKRTYDKVQSERAPF